MDPSQTAYARILEFENAMTMRGGRSRLERYTRNRDYYTGDNMPPDNVATPLFINYIQTINNKHVSYLWGDFRYDIIKWLVRPNDDDSKSAMDKARTIEKWLFDSCNRNNANTIFVEASLDASICGDAFFKCRWDVGKQRTIWETIPPEYIHCMWDPMDMNQISEVIVSYPIHRAQAVQKYGTPGNPNFNIGGRMLDQVLVGMAIYWERWTPTEYSVWIDNENVLTQMNPYFSLDGGIVPFVHIPNFRLGGEFYGYADSEQAFALQDELNYKMADQGDIINNYAHPITLLNKFYGETEQLTVGPDQVWDLGRDGEAKLLTWDGPAPLTIEYIEMVREQLLETAAMSSVAYGRYKGTQQSSQALAMQMLPVTERSKMKRAIWQDKLVYLLTMTAKIDTMNNKKLGFTLPDLEEYRIIPMWAPMLPKDRMALIQENIALKAAGARTIAKLLDEIGEEDSQEQEKEVLKQLKELANLVPKAPVAAPGNPANPGGPTKGTLQGKVNEPNQKAQM